MPPSGVHGACRAVFLQIHEGQWIFPALESGGHEKQDSGRVRSFRVPAGQRGVAGRTLGTHALKGDVRHRVLRVHSPIL
jgi:hypothetical protein